MHTPDLYEGATFDDLDAGVGHAQEIGFDTVCGAVPTPRRTTRPTSSTPVRRDAGRDAGPDPVPRALRGRHHPLGEYGQWPPGLPPIHEMERGDVDVAREVAAATVDGAELFLYPGAAHLFTDDSLAAFDADAAALVRRRVLAFLDPRGPADGAAVPDGECGR